MVQESLGLDACLRSDPEVAGSWDLAACSALFSPSASPSSLFPDSSNGLAYCLGHESEAEVQCSGYYKLGKIMAHPPKHDFELIGNLG